MAHLIAVLDIVVDEREVVQQLECGRGAERNGAISTFALGDGEQDLRAQTLAALCLRIVEPEVLADQRPVGIAGRCAVEHRFEIALELLERRRANEHEFTSRRRCGSNR